MSKFNVGDKVRYVGNRHDINSQWFPSIGTIGTVVQVDDEISYCIQWPKGSTSKEDRWYCNKNDIELVEDTNMTNEEIWEMLESKMRKNGLKKKMGALYCGNNLTNGYWVYTLNDVHNAIALAYKVGYLRAMKGRPFKFGEKKKGGHWEPVDPNNLPKEGTKVRYSRQFNNNDYNTFENRTNMKIGETTVVKYNNFGAFGVKPIHGTREWWCSSSYPDRFDMWVEDDE